MSLLHHVYQRLIAAGWKMLIWRTILAKKEMKDESSYMYWHRQLGMQVSSCSETVNNPYTYTCVDLYMASPLEKKQRTGSVNITQNMDCPVFWLLLDNELLSGRGGVTRFEDEGVRYRRERVRIGWRFNSANRKKKQTGLYCHQLKWTEELWLWTQLTKTPMIIMWPNSETKIMMTCQWIHDEMLHFYPPWSPFLFLWWPTQVLDSFPSLFLFVCLSGISFSLEMYRRLLVD